MPWREQDMQRGAAARPGDDDRPRRATPSARLLACLDAPRRALRQRVVGLRPEWMTHDIGLLLAARVAMSANRALAGVVVPIYLALIGFSAAQLGLLFAVGAVTAAVLASSIGLLSDRLGRKPFIVAIPLLSMLAGIVFTVSRAVPLIFIFAALGSFGRGAGAGAGAVGPYQPAEQALLADSVAPWYRTNVFGFVGFASSLGALIGGPLAVLPVIFAGMGLSRVNAYRPVFLVIAALALTAALLAAPLANPRPRPHARDTQRRRWRLRLPVSRAAWPVLLRLWATNGVNGLAIGFIGPFVSYWFFRRYGASPAAIGVLYAIINLATMASNLGAARVARRLGLVRAIVASRGLQALLLIPMVLAPSFWLAGTFYLLRMVVQRVNVPLRQSFVMGMVPNEERGAVGALSNLPLQASSSLSPAVAGYLFDHAELAVPFELGALLQGINAALFFIFFRHMHMPEEQGQPSLPPPAPGGALRASTPAALDSTAASAPGARDVPASRAGRPDRDGP